ncbi:MAG: AzlD domain-containing protein [Pseudomonadota bacterium]
MSSATLWGVVVGSIAATFVWRLIGAFTVKFLREDHALFEWISCVSYAMLGALILRMLFLPESDLASLSLGVRATAVGIAFIAYYAFRQSLLAGMIGGAASLSILAAIQ